MFPLFLYNSADKIFMYDIILLIGSENEEQVHL